MIRFLHTSDLHLGKPFGRFPEDVRGRLKQARVGVVGRLAAAARAGGAEAVLVAGDSFDAETPSPAVVRQTLNAMAVDAGLRWIVMPGNHDSLAASELWQMMARDAPRNVVLARTEEPVTLGAGAVVLPAPCTVRRPGRDLTEVLDAATPPGVVRIGLAHGAVMEFGTGTSEDGDPAIIPPDRAARSGLDYLALGDWHGQMQIGPRQWYAGTPETDSFKHGGAGAALMVTVAGPGALPVVEPVRTGVLDWVTLALDLQAGEDGAARLRAALPGVGARVDHLMALHLTGRMTLGARAELARAVADVAPDFLYLTTDWAGVATVHDTGDLDLIDRAGALREVADRLAAEADDPALSAEARAVAAAALSRLFGYATEEA
ncbi:MAG: metallophosphoesterase [Rhodobacterales bacterium]|nr:metallophosphoesterase [Rhodobacterales bacterium]